MGGKQHKKKRRAAPHESRQKLQGFLDREDWAGFVQAANRVLPDPPASMWREAYLKAADRVCRDALAAYDQAGLVRLSRWVDSVSGEVPAAAVLKAVALLVSGKEGAGRDALVQLNRELLADVLGEPRALGLLIVAGADVGRSAVGLAPALAREYSALRKAVVTAGKLSPRSGPAADSPIRELAGALADLSARLAAPLPDSTKAWRREAQIMGGLGDAFEAIACGSDGFETLDALSLDCTVVGLLADQVLDTPANECGADRIEWLLALLEEGWFDRVKVLLRQETSGVRAHLQHRARVAWHAILTQVIQDDQGVLLELAVGDPELFPDWIMPEGEGRMPDSDPRWQRILTRVASRVSDNEHLLQTLLISLVREEAPLALARQLGAVCQIARRELAVLYEDFESDPIDSGPVPWCLDDDPTWLEHFSNCFGLIIVDLPSLVPPDQWPGLARELGEQIVFFASRGGQARPFSDAAVLLLDQRPTDPALWAVALVGTPPGNRRRRSLLQRLDQVKVLMAADDNALALLLAAQIRGSDFHGMAEVLAPVLARVPENTRRVALAAMADRLVWRFRYGLRYTCSCGLRVPPGKLAVQLGDLLGGEPAFQAIQQLDRIDRAGGADRQREYVRSYLAGRPPTSTLRTLFSFLFVMSGIDQPRLDPHPCLEMIANGLVPRIGPPWKNWFPHLGAMAAVIREGEKAGEFRQYLIHFLSGPGMPLDVEEQLLEALEILDPGVGPAPSIGGRRTQSKEKRRATRKRRQP